MVVTKNQKNLKPILMEPESLGIKNPYYIIKEESQMILVVTQGKNGVEFNKTNCFLSNSKGVDIYQCLYGQGVLVMQRNDEVGEAKEFKVVTLSQGRQVEVPAGLVICISNVGRNFLVMQCPLIENEELGSKTIIERHGLAYYVVEKKGEIAFEQNPSYIIHPQISTE